MYYYYYFCYFRATFPLTYSYPVPLPPARNHNPFINKIFFLVIKRFILIKHDLSLAKRDIHFITKNNNK